MKKAFTLIELIVTITIIAVLSLVAVVSFSGAQKKARDGRRVQDVGKIQMALEMARQVGKTYPPTGTNLVPTYLQVWPVGPKGVGDTYIYSRPTPYTYTLSARLEDAANNPLDQSQTLYTVTNP